MNGQREYLIYQLKDIPETRDYRYESYGLLELMGGTCDPKNYDQVYSGIMAADDTLGTLYERFNLHHPADFKGRSLSVSDVVVIRQASGEEAAYYVDNIGFKKLGKFEEEMMIC